MQAPSSSFENGNVDEGESIVTTLESSAGEKTDKEKRGTVHTINSYSPLNT